MKKKDFTTYIQSTSDVDELCTSAIHEFKSKADHNKREAMLCFITAMLGTLGAPLFVTLGDEMSKQLTISSFYLSKLIPSILSLGAAFSTAWLQLRKPQQLWTLYRTAQRDLEEVYRAYNFEINDFVKSESPGKLLAEAVSNIYKRTHASWMPLVPSPDRTSGNEQAAPQSKV